MIFAERYDIIKLKGDINMRKFTLLVLTQILSFCVYAAPFGLKMGMTLDEITEQCEEEPSYLENDIYIISPVKKHPLFEYYGVYVDEKEGLYEVRAISYPIKSNKFGEEIKKAFSNIKDRITKTYGRPKVTDRYENSEDSYHKKDEYWFYSLREGSRKLCATWGKNADLADDLDMVVLDCTVSDGFYEGTGQIILYYYFKNAYSVEDEQDSVF